MAVLDLIDAEVDAGAGDVDTLSPRIAPLLPDLQAAKPLAPGDVDYLRLYLSFRMSHACVSAGRWSRAYEWLLCGLSDLPWKALAAGEATTADHFPDRLISIVNDQRLAAQGDARRSVFGWIGVLLYYSWKEGGLREIVEASLGTCAPLVTWATENLTGDQQDAAVEAACHLCTWLGRNKGPDAARAVVAVLEAAAERESTRPQSQKTLCLLLSGVAGEHSSRPSHEWAERGLQYAGLLTGHERLQLLVNRSERSGAVTEFPHIHQAASEYANDAYVLAAQDVSAFNYAQARVFDLLRPFVGRLIREARGDLAVALLGAWYHVPDDQLRRRPVLAYVPSFADTVVYTDGPRVLSYERDTDAALRQLFALQNDALGTSHTVADDHTLTIYSPARPGVPDATLAGEFEQELVRFYALDRLREDHAAQSLAATALLPVQSLAHPVQALMLHQLGTTWPLVVSYQEPVPDRELRKILLWTVGTLGGPAESEAVAGILQAAGIEVVQLAEDLDERSFAAMYEDDQYDAIWINAHGEFAGPDPHSAHLILSMDRTNRITAACLANRRIPAGRRRLLFLNICDGGNVMVTDAPPRLGIAPMLASRHQAVISHLWPVRNFVAATFGALLARGLISGAGFFHAFRDSLGALRSNRPEVLSLLESIDPAPTELIERVRSGPDDFSTISVFNWGSPVFYE